MTSKKIYSFSKKHHYYFSLLAILMLASLIRFYRLGNVPHGMTWDEAAIGYNGYAILHTRRDEWLQRLPISFRSFGDYKAPLAIYLNGFFTFIWGMNLWAVRLPFALASIVAILGLILLVEDLLGRNYALFTGLLMALSPWHIHFSRAGFESGLALAFYIWFLVMIGKYARSKRYNFIKLLLAVCFATFSIYSYHSAKIVIPLTIIITVVAHFKIFLANKKQLLNALALLGLMIYPLAKDSIYGQGLERLGASILDDYQGSQLISKIAENYSIHLTPAFLIKGQTTTLRHGDGQWGILLPSTLLLVVMGLFFGMIQSAKKNKPIMLLSLLLIMIGLLPAAIGEEVPHPNRALLALPGFLLLATLGLQSLVSFIDSRQLNKYYYGSHQEKHVLTKATVGTVILIQLLFFSAYFSDYFSKFAVASSMDFKDGYVEAFSAIVPYEDQVDKILFTSEYGQPYIYALFVRQTNPIWYQGGSLVKYEFSNNITLGDLNKNHTIVVGGQNNDLPITQADKLIRGSDGQVRFKIYLPKN